MLASSRQGLGVAGEATYHVPSLVFRQGRSASTRSISALRVGRAVRRTRASRKRHVFAHRRQRADRRRDLPPARRHSAGDRTRRRAGEGAQPTAAARTARRAVSRAHRRQPRRRCRASRRCARSSTGATICSTSASATLFRRLGIFVDGFTLEGAVAVGSGDGLDELDVFDVLASLVDKSLVAGRAGTAKRCATGCSNRRAPMRWRSSTVRGERDLVAEPPSALSARPFRGAVGTTRANRTSCRS